MPKQKKYWLMKSEPGVYSIDHLKKDGATSWDCIRNYQARNFMRDEMKKGDGVLFYHSNIDEAGIYGTAQVVRESYPDDTSWDKKSKYFDPKSSPSNPRWFMVDIVHAKTFSHPLVRAEMQTIPGLEDLMVLRRGMRLSVQPVTEKQFKIVEKMGC